MRDSIFDQAAKFLHNRENRRKWMAFVFCLAVLVTIVIFYSLSKQGQALTHTERKRILDCPYMSNGEAVAHTHNKDCYDENGNLVCTLPEVEEHHHTDDCYATEEVLICGKEEGEIEGTVETDPDSSAEPEVIVHHHSEDCYETVKTDELICGKEELKEHEHSDSCFKTIEVPIEDEEPAAADETTAEDTEEPAAADEATAEGAEEPAAADETTAEGAGEPAAADETTAEDAEEPAATDETTAEGAGEPAAADETTAEGADESVAVDVPKEETTAEADGSASAETSGETYFLVDEQKKTYSDSHVEVTATYSSKANIPDNAKLVVKQITQESDAEHYEQRVREAGEVLDGTDVSNATNLLFNIGFFVDGAEIEPEDTVTITIQFKDGQFANGDPITLVHFANDGAEVVGSADVDESSATFQTGSFSDFLVTDGTTGSEDVSPQTSGVSGDLADFLKGVSGSGTVNYDKDTGLYTQTGLKIEFSVDPNEITGNGHVMYFNYPQSIIVPDALLNKNYEIKESDGTVQGTYRFTKNSNGTYSVEITFDEDYVSNHSAGNIDGFVSFNGKIKSEAVKEDGSISVEFTDDINLEVSSDKIIYPDDETLHYDVNVSKTSGTLTAVDADGKQYLEYTVTISSKKGTPSPLTVTDTITASGFKVAELEDVKEGTTLLDSSAYTYTTTKNDSVGTLSVTLEEGLSAGETRTLTYRYLVSDMPSGKQYSADNKVDISGEDTTTGEKITSSCTASGSFDKRYKITKNGANTTVDGKVLINWTITVNSNHQDISGGKLTDEMFSDAVGAITVNPSSGYTIHKDNSGKVTDITFTGTPNTTQYTISYQTEVASGSNLNYTSTTNTVDLEINGSDITASKTIETTYGKVDKIKSNFDGTSTKLSSYSILSDIERNRLTFRWKVSIDIPETGLPIGTVIEDKLNFRQDNNSYKNGGTAGNPSEFTEEEQAAIRSAITAALDAVYGTENTGNCNYLINEITSAGFKVTLNRAIVGAVNLTFEYTSSRDRNNAIKGGYYNSLIVTLPDNIGKLADYEDYTYIKPSVTKMDGNGEVANTAVSNADGALTWQVKTVLDGDYGSLTITDTLPSGVELQKNANGNYYLAIDINKKSVDVELSATTDNITYTGTIANSSNFKHEVSYNVETGIVTIVTTPATQTAYFANKTIIVTYNCQVSRATMDGTAVGDKQSFKNDVTVITDTGTFGGASQKQEWTKEQGEVSIATNIVDKTGIYSKDQSELDYTVSINPDGEDLLPDGDELTLTDTLSYDNSDADVESRTVALLPASVKLYYATKAEDGTLIKGDAVEKANWNWTLTSTTGSDSAQNKSVHTITAMVPDSRAMIFEYTYSLQIEKKDTGTPKVGIYNVVDLMGETSSSDQRTENYYESEIASGMSGISSYIFYKVKEGNFNVRIPGAVFTVCRAADDREITTYTSGGSGGFQIIWEEGLYEKNTLYYVTEHQSMEGYILPENPPKYYFYFSENKLEAPTLPSGVTAINLGSESATQYVENAPVPTTTIELSKKWLTESGGDNTASSEFSGKTITVHLLQNGQDIGTYVLGYDSAANAEGSTNLYAISKGVNKWTASISELPQKDENEQPYTYTITEDAVDKYNTEVTSTMVDDVTLRVEIKNKAVKEYELPKTGGVGTMPYTASGLLLLAGAGYVLWKRRKEA